MDDNDNEISINYNYLQTEAEQKTSTLKNCYNKPKNILQTENISNVGINMSTKDSKEAAISSKQRELENPLLNDPTCEFGVKVTESELKTKIISEYDKHQNFINGKILEILNSFE